VVVPRGFVYASGSEDTSGGNDSWRGPEYTLEPSGRQGFKQWELLMDKKSMESPKCKKRKVEDFSYTIW